MTCMQSKPRVELRTDRWVAANVAVGRTTLRERADGAGISYTHLSRVENGKALPANNFIALVLLAFPRKRFDFFFEVKR